MYHQQFEDYSELFQIPTFKSLGIGAKDGVNDKDNDKPVIYFCGNSLGLMPKSTPHAINQELQAWSQRGVEAHFNHPTATDWVDIDLPLVPLFKPLIGANDKEIAVMGTLTMNLNSLLVSFYQPKGKKTKILFEKQAFPSDYYAFLNLVQLRGYDKDHLIQLSPSTTTYLKTQDILDKITEHKDELAMICLPGIQYYTGQFFDIKTITNHAKQYDIVVGWDLAHAVGNVPLSLHDDNVDFAVWCNYKYMNSGPGAIAGIFVHEKHTQNNTKEDYPPRLAGWWGNNSGDRFKMLEIFDPLQSALSYRQSNPSVLDVVALKSSLEVFSKIDLKKLREKSIYMTDLMESLLIKSEFYHPQDQPLKYGFKILTPLDSSQRGCQLSLLFSDDLMEKVFNNLRDNGIICDERRPNVIRLAPVPLYNTPEQVEIVCKLLESALNTFK